MTSYPWNSALVTGVSSGIGEAMARLLATARVPTVLVARRADRLENLARCFHERSGVDHEVLVADLATDDGVRGVAARLGDGQRPVDLLVNNAGFGTWGPFAEQDPGRIDELVRLNVGALTSLSRAALETMVPRGRGWICNVSSVVSFQPGPGMAAYAASKAYVTALSESLHEEVHGSGVKVTALCPGLTRTEFQDVAGATSSSRAVPASAWLSAEDVARAGLAATARGDAISVPGLQYRSMVAMTSLLPRSVKRRAMGLVQRRVGDEASVQA